MTDREKVIEAFKDYEPYAHDFPVVTIRSGVYLSALALLKEQEAKIPTIDVLNEIDRIYRCPNNECGKAFFYEGQRFCDRCGQAVKWI